MSRYIRCLLLQARFVPCCSDKQKGEILSNMETKNYLSRQLGGPRLPWPAVRTLRPAHWRLSDFFGPLEQETFCTDLLKSRQGNVQLSFRLHFKDCVRFIHSWQNSWGMDGMLKFQRVQITFATPPKFIRALLANFRRIIEYRTQFDWICMRFFITLYQFAKCVRKCFYLFFYLY